MPGKTKPGIKMGSGSSIYYWNGYSRDKSAILEINRPSKGIPTGQTGLAEN